MKRYIPMFFCTLFLILTACGREPVPQERETGHHTEQDHHGEPVLPDQSASLPEGVANAGADLIRERVWRGDGAGTWLPLLADVTWEDLSAPAEDGFDCVWEACNDIFSYVEERGQSLTEEEYRVLLSHVQGLDGAYAEGYAGVLYDLYALNPTRFARIALDELPQDQRVAALDGLLCQWGYCHDLDGMSYNQQLERLTARLEEDKLGALAASPDMMRFDYEGQSARFLPVNVSGIYAASYASDHPEVAAVDEQTGLVTAVGPGEAVITLHFEGNGENRDFTCAVECRWQ